MEIELKGGFVTHDPRLDRIPEYDPRNLDFLSRRTLTTLQPKEKTWKVAAHLDQGYEGACAGFAFSHLGLSAPKINGWIDNDEARNLYFKAQKIDEWDGGAYPGAEPFYEGTSTLAAAKAGRNRGYFDAYKWTYDADELALAVGYDGPSVIGVWWFENMMEPDRNGFIHATGEIVGGHCTLIYGVVPSEQYFKVWNSWGPSWGQDGTAKISYADMDYILKSEGEACIPVKRGYVIDPHMRG